MNSIRNAIKKSMFLNLFKFTFFVLSFFVTVNYKYSILPKIHNIGRSKRDVNDNEQSIISFKSKITRDKYDVNC